MSQPHDSGDGHGMIDAGEHADRRQGRGEADRPRRHPGRDARQAEADEEDHHHAGTPPTITEPARRQRRKRERNEGRRSQPQRIAIAAAPLPMDGQHRRREDQHEVVIEEVREIEKDEWTLLTHDPAAPLACRILSRTAPIMP
jgi:hypothetical protein